MSVLVAHCCATVAFSKWLTVIADPSKKDVTWHDGSREKCTNYRFNTKTKDQMFCGSCGSSLGIDFLNEDYYGISVRVSFLGYQRVNMLNHR